MEKTVHSDPSWVNQIKGALRIMALALGVTGIYSLAVFVFAQGVNPHGAEGSLVRGGDGGVLGSVLIAQNFVSPGYFHPRPSAVGYNAEAGGASHLTPWGKALRQRVEKSVARLSDNRKTEIPLDLVTTSASGLDPHITLSAALFQVRRVAGARGVTEASVVSLLERSAERPFPFFKAQPVVNVLRVNLALDRTYPGHF
jgi:K+-transporting ATPase ATPase C chain